MVCEKFCPSTGILKVRESDGMAVRPDRSASRLLAASHISSLSDSEGIQANGLDMMPVRYDGTPSSLIDSGLALGASTAQDEGVTASRAMAERRDWTEGLL